ncbi:hypothetical protein [Streptomyces uncialis]|uniref:hypothetical protein n=1 Tax=Streptomyces uncialis TaxID=1048205 RepID=UPI00225B963B|nr:hypothetical protein [Streptomyces uncialis]MCX4665060.1 hypothetical protein [Streptomyces uncialis]
MRTTIAWPLVWLLASSDVLVIFAGNFAVTAVSFAALTAGGSGWLAAAVFSALLGVVGGVVAGLAWVVRAGDWSIHHRCLEVAGRIADWAVTPRT